MMNLYYKEHKPSEDLIPYVYGFWSMTSDGKDDDLSAVQRCFPAGTIEWIIQVRGKNMRGIKEEQFFHYPLSIFTGICNRANEWQSYGNAELFGVRLTPEAALHVFNLPLKEYTNDFINTVDFMGSKINTVISDIINAENVKDRLRITESFIRSQVKYNQIEPNYFTEAMKLIRQNDELNISNLCEKVYVGERQLQRVFQNNLGITPKMYQKVMRLYKAHQLGLVNEENYTNIAHQIGYADSAHFTREFTDYFGVSPRQHFLKINMKWQG